MNPHLQTSPYLTFIRPNEPAPIKFCTDPVHSRPETDAPPGSRFGVLGLDRQVQWETDTAILQVLEAAAPAPVSTVELIQRYGSAAVQSACDRQWLQDPSQLCTEYYLHSGEIEVTAHCNWGCKFCPVADDPKPRETMPMDLFEDIIQKLGAQRTIKYVGFQFYNEPTLDKYFTDRISVLQASGTKLALYTNASGLTKQKLTLLQDSGVLLHLVVNLPSLDPDEFLELTGAATHRRSVANLDLAVDMGVGPIAIAVNGTGTARDANVNRLRDRYGPRGVEVYPTALSDRAGQVTREPINEHVRISGRLTGCSWPVNHAHFSVRGDTFMCCNDYYQREKFGNIRDGSIHEIMSSPAAVELRRRVFGVDEAAADMICRNCHDQLPDFSERQFRPIASFPLADLQASAQLGHVRDEVRRP